MRDEISNLKSQIPNLKDPIPKDLARNNFPVFPEMRSLYGPTLLI